MARFPIRFDRWYRTLSTVVFLLPSQSYIDIDDDVHVHMGWAFDTRFPRAAITAAQPYEGAPLSRGVHGWGGRWLVNGSAQGLVALTLEPEQRAKLLAVPVPLRELVVSVDDPAALIAALG